MTRRTSGRLVTSRRMQTPAIASARRVIATFEAVSMAMKAVGSVAITKGFGAQSEQPNIDGSCRKSRDALRTRKAPNIASASTRPAPVGSRAGSARTRTAMATS